jgi:hypothetical protein
MLNKKPNKKEIKKGEVLINAKVKKVAFLICKSG